MLKETLAAIDLGTNSCRLTIADKKGNYLYRDSIATKLGEGLYENMRFTPRAFERGVAAFETFARIMENYKVAKYRAIATASCRMADNGLDFVRQVKEKSHITLEVVDGYEEARLNLKGAVQNAQKDAQYVVVYDLGGGSTEITLAKRYPQLEIMHTISIPWGGRNATEAFDLEEYKKENISKLYDEISKAVAGFVGGSELDKFRDKACLIATSSTPLRLISMAEQYGMYEREKADGVTIDLKRIDEVIEQIYQMTLEERIESKYIGENRAPIFIAACTIFKSIYDGLGFQNLTASLKSAQDGMIEELRDNG